MKKLLQNVMCEKYTEANQAMIAIKQTAEAGTALGRALTPAHFDYIRVQENIWCEAMGQYVVAAMQQKRLAIIKASR